MIHAALKWLGIKGGIILALILLCGVQTARIEGFLWVDGFKDEIASLRASLAEIGAAQKVAEQKAIAARAATERQYALKAMEADREHATELSEARAAAERFIAGNRVSAGDRCPSSGAAPAGGDSGAASADGAGGATELVAVTAGDVRICTDNTTRLEAARDWALGLKP